MALRGKMQAYAEARAQGIAPKEAALHAGYGAAGLAVAISRMEPRADLQAEIRRLKRGGKAVDETPESDLSKWAMKDHYNSPLELMLDVMNNPQAPKALRYQSAKDALPYCHARKEGGKKDEQKERATKAAKGKFQTASRPSHLRAVN